MHVASRCLAREGASERPEMLACGIAFGDRCVEPRRFVVG